MTESGNIALLGNQSMFTFWVDGCAEELRMVRFAGEEAISSLFSFRLELATVTIPPPRPSGPAPSTALRA